MTAEPHPPRSGTVRLGAVAAALFLGGCWVTERYIATPEQVTQAAQVPAGEAAATALPVHRYRKTAGREVGKAVFLRADALARSQPELGPTLPASAAAGLPASSPPVLLRSRRYSPVVTAGATLTGVGTVISVVGTIIYFTSTGDTNLAGGIVALSAEPMMLAGTLMWIFGILRPPQEVGAGRAAVRYLESPPVPLAPALPAPPPPALSLRF